MLPDITSVHIVPSWRAVDACKNVYLVQVYRIGDRTGYYITGIRRGNYQYSSDPLYARSYSRKTAQKYYDILINRGWM